MMLVVSEGSGSMSDESVTPITCDVNANSVNSEFATTLPASGGVVRSSTTANVSCVGDEEGETSKYLVRGANSTRHPVSAPSSHGRRMP